MNRVEDLINSAKTNELLGELLHIKKEEEKKADKKKEEEKKAETIQADSIEDLIAAIKAKLHPEETADTTDTEENAIEQNTTTVE